jgi:exosortase E/protease (VPEID-CTERM system)
VNTSSSLAAAPTRFGLVPRLIVIGAVLAVEILLGSYLVQATPLDAVRGPAETLRVIQHWLFRFLIAYAVCLCLLVYLRGAAFAGALRAADHAPVRVGWAVLHVVLILPFLYLSATLYTPGAPFAAMAIAWHALALGAALTLFAALAPRAVWVAVLQKTAGLPLFAVIPAAAAVAAIRASQMLWAPAAALTFRLVKVLLHPLLPGMRTDPVSLTLITDHFAVQIAEVCSGLEGVGLMLAFCVAWLWFFRREYFFPRALIVVPLGVLVVFLLNAVRIAALVLIGDAGYERVATVGFHSQAGWIAFNLAAFGVAILAHTNPWVSRVAAEARARRKKAHAADIAGSSAAASVAPVAAENPTGAYLMPLLAILATGMITHALSAGFEYLYPLRLVAAGIVLLVYRKSYAGVCFGFSWRGPLVGILVFGLWVAYATYGGSAESEPSALGMLSQPWHGAWIACRVLAAVITVPIAEELAYRGYLLRRLVAPQFETVPFSRARWPALLVSAIAFGIMHGSFWLPGIVAGVAFGALAMRTNKLGEAVVAHATSNALLAGYVLLFGRWQLW